MSTSRSLLLATSMLTVAAVVAAATTASATAPGSPKPVIAKPVATPAQPQVGRRFTVSFKVTRSDTGTPLMRGTMICHPFVAGRALPHAESFKRGIARLSFVVPTTAAGKTVNVKVTIKAEGRSATRVAKYRVEELGALSIGDATTAEGNAGTTQLSFPVTLSRAAAQTVAVKYATANGTAVSPSDYTATSGTLAFQPGEKAKTIAVAVVGDAAIEPAETFSVAISEPVNATIADGTATGTISNDDTAVPVTPGSYKGQTQNGNYVFFTVLGNRTLTGFRINDLPCECEPGGALTGGENFGDVAFPIGVDGTVSAEDSWSGSTTSGDIEFTYMYMRLAGSFGTPTSASGTIVMTYELKYEGTHYRCSSGEVRWSASLQN